MRFEPLRDGIRELIFIEFIPRHLDVGMRECDNVAGGETL